MAEFSDLFHSASSTQTVYNQIVDWLPDISNTGNTVTNIALNLANRAQDRLWRYKPWDYLAVEQELSGSYALSSNAVTLPTDFGRMIWVGHDSDGDGKMDYWYYKDAKAKNGYKIRDVFVKLTGHAFTLTFFQTPSQTPTICYQKTLPVFAASGTEYSFFPGDLLFAQAKVVHLEAAPIKSDLDVCLKELDRLLLDYVQQHQYVNSDMRMELLDDNGIAVENFATSLDGEESGNTMGYDNDYDLG